MGLSVQAQLRQMEQFWARLGRSEPMQSDAPVVPVSERKRAERVPRQRQLNLAALTKQADMAAAKRALRLRLIEHFGGKCLDCGIVGPAAIYQFDHRDPFEKARNVSSCPDWDTALAEAVKCDLVCCNCHAIRTQADTERIQRKIAFNRAQRRIGGVM